MASSILHLPSYSKTISWSSRRSLRREEQLKQNLSHFRQHCQQAPSSVKVMREMVQHQLQPLSIVFHRGKTRVGASLEREILPNALCRTSNPLWRGGFSLGVDLGLSRTGLALGKGFFPRPLTVLELRGQKLELCLLEIARKHEVDEFIIGLPISRDGKETLQSHKVRSFAGGLAIRAAERGWRVFLQDEHGTSVEAIDFMIDKGVKRHARQEKIDSYSAVVLLERYFGTSGHGAELILPKKLALQEMLRRGPSLDQDFFPDE